MKIEGGANRMKNLKLILADGITKVAETAAKKAAGSASWGGFHQPKEPSSLSNYFCSKKQK